MKEMIKERRNSIEKSENFDLFTGLLESADDPKDQLTDDELIGALNPTFHACSRLIIVLAGNVFIFLVAGHEVGARVPAMVETTDPVPNDRRRHIPWRLHSVFWRCTRRSRRSYTSTFAPSLDPKATSPWVPSALFGIALGSLHITSGIRRNEQVHILPSVRSTSSLSLSLAS